MICAIIKGPTFEDAFKQLSKAVGCADLVELRLDCFYSIHLAELKSLRTHFSIPMIFTLRSQIHGGSYTQSEESRLSQILSLADLEPEYFDIENYVSPHFIKKFSSQYPSIKVVLSYHNYSETPQNLESIYQEMQKIPAFYYKLAVMAKSSIDALRLLCWSKKNDDKLIAISMGGYGQISRILGPVVGCPITYAALDEDHTSAPGQLDCKILIERFRHYTLTPKTKVFGLIGDPVDQSISDITHNYFFTQNKIDAVYVKIKVSNHELSDFFRLARELPFSGLSVTMPLKELILPFIDSIDPQAYEIGAVNTLLFEKNKIMGFNTDGMGALNAVEKCGTVEGKKIVLIGAGGATKAIAFEAIQRGAFVTILNRNEKKAQQLANRLKCTSKALNFFPNCAIEGYDILINGTPSPMPIDPTYINTKATVMDIKTKPKDTLFIQQAKAKGCPVVFGYEMFVEQALGQFNHWFKSHVDIEKSRKILEEKALQVL